MFKRFLCLALLAAGVLGASAASAASAVEVGEVRTQIGDAYVAYPQLEGLEDEAVMKAVNDDIVLSADIASHLITLATLGESTWGLKVDYETYLQGDVFSTVISAKGKMPTGREGHAYTALTYDLLTGQRLTPQALFTDADAAAETLGAMAEASLSRELSDYLDHSAITPLPLSSFTVNADGVTFWYASDQLSYLSGYSGACQFFYEELDGLLRTDEEGLAVRIGAWPRSYTASRTKSLIETCVSEGWLEHIPVQMGQPMTELTQLYRLVRTPDAFPGGRYFVLEAPVFRDVLVISDSLEAGYEHSVVEGIQLRRGGLYGLMIGQTESSYWREALGEPQEVIAFSENMAYDYGLPVGESDVYHFGAYELRLHADETGVLRAIQLCQ